LRGLVKSDSLFLDSNSHLEDFPCPENRIFHLLVP
jgi:hypothetical protein